MPAFRRSCFLLSALVALSGLLGLGTVAQATAAAEPSGGLELFLLAGQSNMAGRAPVEAFDRLIWPTILAFNADGEWVPAQDPLHFDKPALVGVGPGLTFGRIVAEALPGKRVGLVPAAVGGTSITVWADGVQHSQTLTYPYDDAVRRARRAMEQGRLRAILWIQGESDATEDLVAGYYERLVDLIARFRRDLTQPDLPFIIGQRPALVGGRENGLREAIDAAQRRAATEIPRVWYVAVPLATPLPDGVHVDAPSAREIGRRLAQCYLTEVRDREAR